MCIQIYIRKTILQIFYSSIVLEIYETHLLINQFMSLLFKGNTHFLYCDTRIKPSCKETRF